MLRRMTTLLIFASPLIFAACSAPPNASHVKEAIPADDDPDALTPGASRRLADIIQAADVGTTFSVPDNRLPYPDTYWPFKFKEGEFPWAVNGIDMRWQLKDGKNEPSALEKYMQLTHPASMAAAKSWERDHHGEALPGVDWWFGHCPGWTASALSNPPILRPVFAKFDTARGVTACTDGEPGCIKFEIGDINALEAEVFLNSPARFIGSRCDTASGQIERDSSGRVLNAGCKGLNPGALLVVLSDQIRLKGAPIAINAQNDTNTNEIWNQPAYAYTVNDFRALTQADAAARVTGSGIAPQRYEWNADARGFALVDVTLKWVTETLPNTTVVSARDSSRDMRMLAVLELDLPASDPAARIIGGEFLDGSAAANAAIAEPEGRTTRLTVPPFVWVPTGPGPDNDPSDDGHNPYVAAATVLKLVEMGR